MVTFDRLLFRVFMVHNVSIFESVVHDSNSIVSCDVAGALKGPVCEKIININYLIHAGNKNHRLSVYNPNEVTFLYYAFLKSQSYTYGIM